MPFARVWQSCLTFTLRFPVDRVGQGEMRSNRVEPNAAVIGNSIPSRAERNWLAGFDVRYGPVQLVWLPDWDTREHGAEGEAVAEDGVAAAKPACGTGDGSG